MKLLKVPAVFTSRSYDEYPESMREELIEKDEGEIDDLWINPSQIGSINKSYNRKETTLWINGVGWRIKMPVEEFLKLLEEFN